MPTKIGGTEDREPTRGVFEEELAVFDILTKPEKPAISLTEPERRQVKKAARDLLDTLKREKLVLDWRKRQQTRVGVEKAIQEALDRGLPEKYGKELYDAKCAAVFQHVHEAYRGAGESIYGAV